ncbi:MAG: 50S ribosomal protein L25 [Bacteroidota bacterium]|nr:50S ribosomal protein L25 [Bacteroidota bacterium]
MKKFVLTGKLRDTSTKKEINRLRKEGFVPAVIYGDKIKENISIYCFINDLRDLVYTDQVYMVVLNVEGKEYKTVIKNIQFNPLSDDPIHLDFMEVTDDKEIKIYYPISLVGTPLGITEGGKVFRKLRKIRLKGKVSDLPETLEINIEHLKLGDTLKIGEIEIPNIEVLASDNTPVVGVSIPKLVELPEVGEEGLTDEELEEGEGEEGDKEGEEGEEGEKEAEATEEKDSK